MSTQDRIPNGTVIRDTYTVDSYIGSGGFADVYCVRHQYMGMQAMKVLRDVRSEESRTQGLTEAFHLSRISHPSIIRVFDGNRLEEKHGALPYLTMELIEGGTLDEALDGNGPDFIGDLVKVATQLADALSHAHSMTPPIVHRDVKPTNVLTCRTTTGALNVRLADFGLATPIDPNIGFTTGGGTVMYRSPESLDGFEVPASDVYSFGLTLYECASGVMPFRAATRAVQSGSLGEHIKALRDAQSQRIEAPSYYRHSLHPAIDTLVMRCLVHDSSQRIQDGNSLRPAVEAMRRAVEGDPTPTPDVRKSLRIAQDPTRTGDALRLMKRSIRKLTHSQAVAYLPFVTFFNSEIARIEAYP
jgi:serine/threonine protein kinase